MKEIEERIKKQIKTISNSPNSSLNSKDSVGKPLSTHSKENEEP